VVQALAEARQQGDGLPGRVGAEERWAMWGPDDGGEG
jgi:hypothetical protein